MFRFPRLASFLLLALSCTATISAPQNPPHAQHPPGRLVLDVVVAEKSGPPLAGLQAQDFTILDNQAPQTIASFKAVSGREADLAVILVTDPVNASIANFVYTRTEVAKFLRADGGHLAHLTLLATLTDKGAQIEANFSTDGNALAAALDRNNLGPRSAALDRSAGVYGQGERLQLSIQALDQIVASTAQHGAEADHLAVPGWPFLAEVHSTQNSRNRYSRIWYGSPIAFSRRKSRSTAWIPQAPRATSFAIRTTSSSSRG